VAFIAVVFSYLTNTKLEKVEPADEIGVDRMPFLFLTSFYSVDNGLDGFDFCVGRNPVSEVKDEAVSVFHCRKNFLCFFCSNFWTGK